jgi:quercetin dioxygenase-like cupin family protein
MRRREVSMQRFLTIVLIVLAAAAQRSVPATAARQRTEKPPIKSPTVVLDNLQVRAWRTTADAFRAVGHVPAVVVPLDRGANGPGAAAIWVDDVSTAEGSSIGRGSIVVVQPLAANAAPPPSGGSKPGDVAFTGMSFKPLFENDRVSVISAGMEIDAREGFHTHASDTVVVYLSPGEIEDTADAKTEVRHWKPGDVEFEGRGTSHSAKNVGAAIDVVLVVLKPR